MLEKGYGGFGFKSFSTVCRQLGRTEPRWLGEELLNELNCSEGLGKLFLVSILSIF